MFSSFTYNKAHERGFTLVETMVSVAVFMIVIVIAVGSLVSLIDANRKARTQKLVSTNLTTTLDAMSRAIREGSGYAISDAGKTLTFVGGDGSTIVFRQNGAQIDRLVNGGSPIALTAPDVVVTDLYFSAVNYGGGAAEQPKILMNVKAYAGEELATRSNFNLQSMVSQRYKVIGAPQGASGSVSCKFDLAIIMDTSGSLDATELQQSRDAAAQVVNNLVVGPDDANIAIINFGGFGVVHLPFSSNLSTIQTSIQNIGRLSDTATNLPAGLLLANGQFATSRTDAPDVALVITDGAANRCTNASGQSIGSGGDCSPPLAASVNPATQSVEQVDAFRANNGFIFVVGVGVPANALGANYAPFQATLVGDFLRDSVANPDAYAGVDNYADLQELVSNYNCQFFGVQPTQVQIQPF